MKKYIAIIIAIFGVLGGVCGFYDFLVDANTYRVLGGVSLAMIGIALLVYSILAKKKSWIHVIISLGVILSIATGYIFLTSNYLVGAIFMFVASALIVAGQIIKCKNIKPIIFLSIAIAIPTMLTLIFAKFYGFDSVLCQIANIIYMLAVSSVLAIAIHKFYKKQNLHTSLLLAFGIMFYTLNFLIVLNRFSNLTRHFGYIITALFVVCVMLFAFSKLYKKCCCCKKEGENQNANDNCKTLNKGIIKFSISMLIAMLFIMHSFVGIFTTYKVAGPKMTKEQFMNLYADDLQIPIVEINTENNQLPKTKEEYLNCSFSITNCADPDDNFSVSMKGSYDDADGVGIRLRGNSTKLLKKQPFRIKFEEKKSVLGLEENKSWVLLADYLDNSYIKNFTAFSLAKNFDKLDFTPTPNHVALIINNQFKGLYLLCEQIDENSGRVGVGKDIVPASEYASLSDKKKKKAINFDVATDFPFLVEMDRNAHKEGTTGVDNFYVNDFYPVEIKYPESDERCRTATEDKVYDYINEYVSAVFETLKTGEKVNVSFRAQPVGFDELVDINSLIDYYLINEIMHNSDNAWGSIYLYKAEDGLLKFGPVWDFDWSMSQNFDGGYDISEIESAKSFTLMQKSKIYSKVFKNEENYVKLQTRFNEIKGHIIEVADYLGEYKNVIKEIARVDSMMWHGQVGELNYDYVRLYLYDRYAYMQEMFSKNYDEFITQVNI